MAGAGVDSLQLSSTRRRRSKGSRTYPLYSALLRPSYSLCLCPTPTHRAIPALHAQSPDGKNHSSAFRVTHYGSQAHSRGLHSSGRARLANLTGKDRGRSRSLSPLEERVSTHFCDGRGRRLGARMRRSTLTEGDPIQDVTKLANGQTKKTSETSSKAYSQTPSTPAMRHKWRHSSLLE